MPSVKEIESKAFLRAGVYIIRYDDLYLAISCGPNSPNSNFTHAHNDKLSFELNFKGYDFVVDPGTYTYTTNPDARNLYRSTTYHNTIRVDQHEQNVFIREDIFALPDDTKAQCVSFEANGHVETFLGEHYGYQKLNDPVIHQRKFTLDKKKKYIEIEDNLLGKDVHYVETIFNIHPDINVVITNNRSIVLEKDNICIELTSDMEKYNLRVENVYYSPGLGIRVPNKQIIFERHIKLPTRSKFKIVF